MLCGVCAFSVPMSESVIPKWLNVRDPVEGIELGRLVLLDDPSRVGFSAESWFVARAFRLLRQKLPQVQGVVAFSDPTERRDENGVVTKRGHMGIVYRASSARFAGRTKARWLHVTPRGRVITDRALSKLLHAESGADYVERQMRDQGCPARGCGEMPKDYIARLVKQAALRRELHPGNLAFVWAIKREAGRSQPSASAIESAAESPRSTAAQMA